jgi:tetratricopeptide (TPR) repeat protein/predicted Ser/Thr protein kinase
MSKSLEQFLDGLGALDREPFWKAVVEDQRQRWAADDRVQAEVYLEALKKKYGGCLELWEGDEGPVDVVFNEFKLRDECGEGPVPQEYQERFPQYTKELQIQFQIYFAVEGGAPPTAGPMASQTHPGATAVATGPEGLPSIRGYDILKELGRGGMGVVYMARQVDANRLVALKMIRSDEPNPEDVHRFLKEAETVAHFDHPNIVPVYEVGQDNGNLFFSMKLVEGGGLDQHLPRYCDGPPTAALLVAVVARAVQHAHQRGVLHRDLKPPNILLGTEGQPYVTDFGLAKRIETESGPTQSGALLGTPEYMAPEQTTGQRGAVTTATDVHGLGAVLYALLTGRPPFKADTLLDTLMAARGCEPVPPRNLNPRVARDLETICLKCLEKEPAKRYPSAEALADDLDRWLTDKPIQARRVGLWERGVKLVRRNRWWAAAGALVGLLLLVVVGLIGRWVYDRYAEEWRLANEAHQRTQEGERLAGEADKSYDSGDYPSSKANAAAGLTRVFDLPGADGLRERLLRRKEEAEARLRRADFLKEAAEAEYHILGVADLFAPPPPPNQRFGRYERGIKLADGIDHAKQALARYDLQPGAEQFRDTDVRGLDPQEVDKLRGRAAELMVLLGLALDQRDQGKDALEAFNRAEGFGNRSHFLYLRRASLRGPPQDPAADDRDKVAKASADSFLDIRLRAANFVREGRWNDAVTEYRTAAALRPDEYWTHFRLAHALGELRQWDRAYEAMASCKSLRDDATAWNESGFALLNLDRWKEAIEEFKVAREKDPGHLRAHGNLARAYGELGRIKDAEDVLDNLPGNDPESLRVRPSVYNSVAMAYDRAAERSVGVGPVCFPVGAPPGLALAVTGLAAAQDRKRLYEAAERHFGTATQLDPDDPAPYHNRALVLRLLDRFKEAEESALCATCLAPDDGESWFALGFLYHSRDRLREALEAYDQAIELGRKASPAPVYLAKSYLQRCQVHVALEGPKGLEKALKDQNEVIRLTPGPEAYYTRAGILAEMGSYPEALDDLNLLVKMEPSDVRYVRMRGEMWGRLQGFDALEASKKDLSTALKFDPDNPATWHNRGIALLSSKKWADAARDFEECLRRLPPASNSREKAGRATTLAGLSFARLELGNLRSAISASDEVLQLAPDVSKTDLVRALAMRAVAVLRLDDGKAALSDLDHVLRLDPNVREIRLLRALANHRLANDQPALDDLQLVRRQMPNMPHARLARGLVYCFDGTETLQAIIDLTFAVENADLELFRPFAIAFRARASLRLGESGALAAARDADALARLLPVDVFGQLESGRLLAQASSAVPRQYRAEMVQKAIDRLSNLIKVRPDLREKLAADPDLAPLADESAFKRLTEKR